MSNSFTNKLVVWLVIVFAAVVLYPAFRKLLRELKEIYRENKGIKIK